MSARRTDRVAPRTRPARAPNPAYRRRQLALVRRLAAELGERLSPWQLGALSTPELVERAKELERRLERRPPADVVHEIRRLSALLNRPFSAEQALLERLYGVDAISRLDRDQAYAYLGLLRVRRMSAEAELDEAADRARERGFVVFDVGELVDDSYGHAHRIASRYLAPSLSGLAYTLEASPVSDATATVGAVRYSHGWVAVTRTERAR